MLTTPGELDLPRLARNLVEFLTPAPTDEVEAAGDVGDYEDVIWFGQIPERPAVTASRIRDT